MTKANGKMRACSLGLVGKGFRVRDKVRLGLVLGIGLVLSH